MSDRRLPQRQYYGYRTHRLDQRNMRVSMTRVGQKTQRFPKENTCGCRIDGYDLSTGLPCVLEQGRSQHAASPESPVRLADVKATHAESARHNRIDRQAPDAGEHAVHTRCQQHLTWTIETHRARHPIGSEAVHEQITLAPRLRLYRVEARRKGIDYNLKL